MVPGRRYTPRYVANLLRRHWFVATAPVLFFGGIAVLLAKALPNVYYSQATVQIMPHRIPENLVKSTVFLPIPERLRAARENVLTTARMEQLIHELDLYPQLRERVPIELLAGAMRRAVRLELVRADTVIVGFSGYERDKVAKVADKLLTLFIEQSVRDRAAAADSTSQFLETELEAARTRLLAQEREVQAYREQHAGELPSNVEANLRLMQATYGQLQAVQEALRQDRERRNVLETALATAKPTEVVDTSDGAPVDEPEDEAETSGDAAKPAAETTADDADPIKLPPGPPSKRLQAARLLVEGLRTRLTPEHPDMQRAERMLKQLEDDAAGQSTLTPARRAGIRAYVDGRIRQAQADLDRVNKQIADREAAEGKLREMVSVYQSRVETVPERVSEWTDLTRDYGTSQQVYANLLAKREEARIAASLERQRAGEQFKVIGKPAVPDAPASPKRPVIVLMGLMLGIGLALAAVLLYELRDTTIRGENEVLTNLGLPVLAMVPVIVTGTDRRRSRSRKLTLSAAALLVMVVAVALRWF